MFKVTIHTLKRSPFPLFLVWNTHLHTDKQVWAKEHCKQVRTMPSIHFEVFPFFCKCSDSLHVFIYENLHLICSFFVILCTRVFRRQGFVRDFKRLYSNISTVQNLTRGILQTSPDLGIHSLKYLIASSDITK